MAPLTAILTTFLSLLAVSSAHNIQMKAHTRECFHEELHKDDKMTVTFQVGDREFGGSGNIEIDFWVCHFVNSPATAKDSLHGQTWRRKAVPELRCHIEAIGRARVEIAYTDSISHM